MEPTRACDTASASLTTPDDGSARAFGYFTLECRDAEGNLEWKTEATNSLANDGQNYLRDCAFNLNTPALFGAAPYIGLATAAPTATSTLATVSEATGGGYARKQGVWVGVNPGAANNTASPASWTASGTAMNGVTSLFVTNVASGTTGKLFSFIAALSGGPYTVNVGSTLNVTYSWSVA